MNNRKKTYVYLIDPVYENTTLSSFTFPLGIGFLASYLKKTLGASVHVEIFRFVGELEKAIKRRFPDVLAATNYPWTCELSSCILRHYKNRDKSLLTVMGGPNISFEPDEQEQFLRKRPQIDFYIKGDGEEPFTHLVQSYIKMGKSIIELKNGHGKGLLYITSEEDFVSNPHLRNTALEDLPSPYLDGTFDSFFGTKLFPLMQSNRGCPFSCAFCQESNLIYNRIYHFPLERVKAELDYIAERATNSLLYITDSNFAMYPRDKEICVHIRTIQDAMGWPKSINCATGKKAETVMECLNILQPGTIKARAALQSTNPETLKVIGRKNIDAQTYIKLKDRLNNPENKIDGQIIVPLPMETFNSHTHAYKFMFSASVDIMQVNTLMLLTGTELSTMEFRERYGMKTRFRILPLNSGEFFGEKCFEYEEVCVATDTFSLEDFKKARLIELIMNVMHSTLFQPFLKYIQDEYDPFVFVMEVVNSIRKAPVDLGILFDEYGNEIVSELFETEEALKAYYSQDTVFQKMLNNEIGRNLVQTYYCLLVTDLASQTIDFFQRCIPAQIREPEIKGLKKFMLMRYVNLKEEFDRSMIAEFDYNIAEWFSNAEANKLSDYKIGTTIRFLFNDQTKQEIRMKLESFGQTDVGIANLLWRTDSSFLKREICAPR